MPTRSTRSRLRITARRLKAKHESGNQPMIQMKTHYPDATRVEPVNRHTLAVVVDNEPGVLARIAGLFSGRGYNIEKLTVTTDEVERFIKLMTVVGLVEVSRTGVAAMARGAEGM